MQDSASFWTDIKKLEEQLAEAPDSLCFARLSNVYLKVGLVDDALHVARQGTIKHPRYLSGQKALSLACHAKGLDAEALAALKLVTEALPEDVPSQKLLGRLLAETGQQDAACQAFRTALEFAPDDVECRIELEYLERLTGKGGDALEPDDELIIEDLEMLEDDQPDSGFQTNLSPQEPDSLTAPHHDPLSTGTLAELYVRQGFVQKALEIYRAILADNPSDNVMSGRIAELEALEAGSSESGSENGDSFEEFAEEQTDFCIPARTFFQETGSMAHQESASVPMFESQQASVGDSACESVTPAIPPLTGVADNVLAALDGWLENIGRIKACR